MRCATLALMVVCVGCSAKSTQAPQASGPDATFTTADGKQVKLSDYRGKKAVVLLFQRGFPGEFACYYCGKQTRAYKESYEKVKGAGAEVLMVLPGATDPKGYLQAVGEADQEHPEPGFTAPYPVICDTDFAACKVFNIPFDTQSQDFPVRNPATIVIGKDGAVLYEYHGKNPSDRPEVATVLEVVRTGKPVAALVPKTPVGGGGSALKWSAYDEGMKTATAQKKPILIDFYADW